MAEKKKRTQLEKYRIMLNLLFLVPGMMFLWTNNIPYLLPLLAYFLIPATMKKLEKLPEQNFEAFVKGSTIYLSIFFSLFVISFFL